MKNFHEWLNEAHGMSMMLQDAVEIANSGRRKVKDLLIKPDYTDKSKCPEYKEEHNLLIGRVDRELESLVDELKMVSVKFAIPQAKSTVGRLHALQSKAGTNEYESKLDGCGIPSPFTSLKNPGVAEKISQLPRTIKSIAEQLEKWINMSSMNSMDASPSEKPEEEEGIYSKLFGKKGWLNPDAYAKPVKRPEKPRLPKI